MTNEQITDLVLRYMDDVSPDIDNDIIVNVVHPLIPSHIDYAALRLLEILPVFMQSTYTPTSLPAIPEQKSDYLLLQCPSDFIKLGRVKLPGWTRAVSHAYNEYSPGSQAQSFRYLGGTNLRPTAVLVQVDGGKYALELRPVSGGTYPDVFMYVKKRKANELEDQLIDPLVWLIAARLFDSMQNPNASKICMQQLTNYIQGASQKSQ